MPLAGPPFLLALKSSPRLEGKRPVVQADNRLADIGDLAALVELGAEQSQFFLGWASGGYRFSWPSWA